MSELQAINSVFNIEIEKIDPNPDQPRKHFSQESLRDLSESIRRYGVMQPITVVRRENETEEGITTRYEIIAGERRWRASVLAGMATIPAIIRESEESEQERFELSILENLQREDLNPVDKARSFARLADEFGMKHAEIADKLGKSREYVTNALRLLVLPENVLDALSDGEISEGHTRPLLSLKDKPDELQVLFNEIKIKSLTVRDAEKLARELSGKSPKTSKYSNPAQAVLDPEMEDIKAQLAQTLGTPVSIDKKEHGGKLTIEFFSRDDLKKLLAMMDSSDMADVIAQQNTQNTDYVKVSIEPQVASNVPLSEVENFALENTESVSVALENSANIGVGTAEEVPMDLPKVDLAEELVTESPVLENSHAVEVEPAIENSIADFVGVDASFGTNTEKNSLPDDFDITPRYQSTITEEVLQDKPVIDQSAYRSEPVREFGSSIADNTERINQLQQEIDSLVNAAHEQNTADVAGYSLGSKKVDLGELDFANNATSQEKQDLPQGSDAKLVSEIDSGLDQVHHIEGTRGGFSQSVTGVGSDFMPNSNTDLSSPAGVDVVGNEFVPDQVNEPVTTQAPETTPDINIYSGGQDFSSLEQGNKIAESDPQNPPINSNEKYPNGDPYRLDNFSI